MKHSITVITLLLLISGQAANAQYKDFNIASYKLPDVKTSYLDLNVNLNHSADIYSSRITSAGLIRNKEISYSGFTNARFYSMRNSEKYQGVLNAAISLSPYFSKSETNTSTGKNNTFSGSLSASGSHRFFLNNLMFIEVDPYFNYNNAMSNGSTSTGTNSGNSNNLLVSAPFSIGYGRIEPVEDARLAVYILDELSKNGKVAGQLSEATIIELARKISEIKKKRFFDSRIRRISEMEEIDSFLVANNIIEKGDIRYFTILSDQWDYASGPARRSGLSVDAGIDNLLTVSKTDLEYKVTGLPASKSLEKQSIYLGGLFVRAEWAKPINLYWQSDLSGKVKMDLQKTVNPLEKSDPVTNFNTGLISASVNYSLRFIPDTRTQFSLFFNGVYTNKNSEGYITYNSAVVESEIAENIFDYEAGINIYYYMSPRLRLTLDWSFNGTNSAAETSFESVFNDSTHNTAIFKDTFHAGLIYSFF
jgi:hypothetical protein